MRKMKSRVLAVLMAAGMIFTAQGMTVLAGTTGIGAAKTASQTGGPGEVKQDIGTVTVDDTQETSGETGQNTGSQENAGGTVQPSGQDPLQVNYSVYFRNQGWSNPAADNQALSASSESWVTSMKANLINIPSGAQIGVRYKVNLSGTASQPFQLRFCRLKCTVCVITKCHGYVSVSHEILQGVWVHSSICHIRTISMPE